MYMVNERKNKSERVAQDIDAAERAVMELERSYKKGSSEQELTRCLEKLGSLYGIAERYEPALAVYTRLADMAGNAGKRVEQIAALDKLAAAHRYQFMWDEAEAVHLRVLALLEESSSKSEYKDVRAIADRLCLLAWVYLCKEDWGQAENALKKASDLFDQAFAGSNNYARLCQIALADLSRRQGKSGESDDYIVKSMSAVAQPVKMDAAEDVSNQRALIELLHNYFKQGRFVEVDILLAQTVYSDLSRLWPAHPLVGQDWHDRGELFLAQGCGSDAEKAFRQALAIRCESAICSYAELAATAMSLATMYVAQGRFVDAEPVLKQALRARVLAFGVQHSAVAAALETYVSVLKNTKRQSLAIMLESRARDIRTELVRSFERAAATTSSS